jgi:CubicO group peptidase (beta-lactamase class C family)
MNKTIDEILKNYCKNGNFIGINLLVRKDGREVYYGEAGKADIEAGRPVRRDTVFHLYSMSKPVTSTAVMKLLEDGKLELDSPVSRYLPAFKHQMVRENGAPVPAQREVTINDLLNMTSGMAYPGDDTPEVNAIFEKAMAKADAPDAIGTVDFINMLAGAPLMFQPGSRWRYGTSADVLGAVVEVVSGMRFGDYLRENFFAPLGMKDTAFYIPPEKKGRLAAIYRHAPGKPLERYADRHLVIMDYSSDPAFQSGGAGLFSTADDYMRLISMLAAGGELDGRRYLSEKTIRFMRTDRLTGAQRPTYDWVQLHGYGYGNLMRVLNDPAEAGVLLAPGAYGWDGWSGTFMDICPEENLQLVMMTAQVDVENHDERRCIRNAVYRQFVK